MSLTLYFRSGCSLCDEMQAELFKVRSIYYFELLLVDVDSDPVLVNRYGHKVPVLVSEGGEEICHYYLDTSALESCFSSD